MGLLQAVVVGLLALIIVPGYSFYFDVTPKVAVLLAGAALALLVWGAAPRARGGRYFVFSGLLLLSLGSLAVSTALSASPALSAFGTNWRRFGSVIQAAILLFAWLVASSTAGHPERSRTILRSVTAAGGLSAIYGILQYFGWDPVLPASGYHIGEGLWTIVRPPGTFGYVSYFATWLLFVAFLSLALAAVDASAWWKRAGVVVAGLSTVAMLLTGTRAAVLGLVAGAAAGLYLARQRPAARGTPSVLFSWRLPVAAIFLVIAGVGFYYSPAGWQLRSRTRWFVEDPWGGARPTLWRDSLRMGISKLSYGYGPETFTASFPRFESKPLAEAYPDFLYESPHNIFLDALVSQGLPGLLILAGLCWAGLRGGFDSRGAGRWIRAALVAGIVSQQFTVFTVPTAVIFYVTIALAVGFAAEASERRHGVLPRLAAAPVALALMYLAVRITIADHALARARHAVESGDLPAAVAAYDRHRRWNLPGSGSDLWYSRAMLGLAQKTSDIRLRFQAIAQSGAAAVRATKTAEDPFNAWYNMAVLYATQNDSARTESSLRSAIAANPNWFKPHWTLAQLLRLEQRLPEAEQEAAVAAELDAGKNPEVTRTLAEIRAQVARALPAQHE